MRLLSFIYVFIFGVVLTVALLFLNLPTLLIYVVIIVVYIILIVLPPIYTIYKSNNLKKWNVFWKKISVSLYSLFPL